MKKILITLFTAFYFLSNLSFAIELEGKETTGELPFEINRCRVEVLNENSGMVSFELTNLDAVYYSKLYYEPSLSILLEKENDFWYEVPYFTFEPVKFEIGANENKKITYNFELPNDLVKGEYKIEFTFYENASRISSETAVILLGELGKERGFLDFSKEGFWKIGKEEILASSGPTINENTNITAVIPVKSSYTTTKRFIPQITIYERTRYFSSKPVKKSNGKVIEIKPNERKNLEIEVPKILKPESYLVVIRLLDENSNISSFEYTFRYVVEGTTANILSVTAGITEDLATDVKLRVVGPADGSSIDGKIEVQLYLESGILLGSKVEELKLNNSVKDINIRLGKLDVQDNTKVRVLTKIYSNDKEIKTDDRTLVMRKTNSNNVNDLTDVVGTKYEEAVVGLNSLGIISGYLDSTYRPEDNISRAEITAIVCKIGKYDTSLKEEIKFKDVVYEHWAKNYIGAAYNNGIISGYPDGTFKPSDNVKYSEVVTMLLNLMGYRDEMQDSPLGWPYNYLTKAEEIGITKDVDTKNYDLAATRGDVALMVWQVYKIKQ